MRKIKFFLILLLQSSFIKSIVSSCQCWNNGFYDICVSCFNGKDLSRCTTDTDCTGPSSLPPTLPSASNSVATTIATPSQINFNNPASINNLLTSTNQDITACLTNCSNNGVCQLDPSTQKLLCTCDQYFTGSKCNIDTRPCSYGPCLNNATCINTNLTSPGYLCECNQFYTGTNCETQIDLCQNETCSSNGKCSIVDNKPECKCFQYYSGDNCKTQSQTLVVIKSFIETTSIIAIILIIAFYMIIVISDVLKFLVCNKEKRFKKKQKNQVKPTYSNIRDYEIKEKNFV